MKFHKSVRLTDNVYAYIWQGMGNNCNTTVITGVLKGDRQHVIIDPGHNINESGEDCYPSLELSLNEDGIRLEDIGLIINTHSHPDHCQANELIVSKSGAGIAMSAEEDDFRNSVGERMYTMFGLKPPRFSILFHLKEGDLDLGKDGFKAQVILTPGHSPGSVCLYLPEAKVLVTGDVVFYMSVGRTDFPGGNTMLLKKSIDKLAVKDVEYIIPGHNTEPNGVIRGREKIKRNFEAVKMFFD
jgi:glyoxylase-like metal-dependent hydrolase (beta-lactamase superfamily II)